LAKHEVREAGIGEPAVDEDAGTKVPALRLIASIEDAAAAERACPSAALDETVARAAVTVLEVAVVALFADI
jgi:hypothetical protein